MEDEALFSALGASVVDQDIFEQKLLTHLEEKLKEAQELEEKGGDDTEEGEISDDEAVADENQDEPQSGGILIEEKKKTAIVTDEDKQNLGLGSRLKALLTAPKTPKTKHREATKPLPTEEIEEESEQQRKIRNGEMTPFGSEVVTVKSSMASSKLGQSRYFS